MRDVISTLGAPKAIGPYSQAIRANGFVFVSGQVAIDPATQQVIEGDATAQTERVMKNLSAVLKAADAGVDVADAAVAAVSGGTSQPNLNSIVEALRHTPRDTQLDIEALNECSDYWETVRTYYLPFDSGPKAGSARLYQHEIPGGQYTNLREQATALGLGHRWREVERMYAEVNQLFGDIVKVTPSSKVVGDMTLLLMAKEMRPKDVLALNGKHDMPFPNSVVEMFSGALGVPPGGWPRRLQKIILNGRTPLKGRPSASLPPACPSARPVSSEWNEAPPRSLSMACAIHAPSARSEAASCTVIRSAAPVAGPAAALIRLPGTSVAGAMACIEPATITGEER